MSLGLVGALAAATSAAALMLARASGSPGPTLPLPHPDRTALLEAGWPHGLRRWEALRLLAVAFAAGPILVLGAPLPLAALAALAPSVWVRLRAEASHERARRAILPLVVATEAALRSGTSLPDALRRALDAVPDPIAGRPLVAALRAFDLGGSLDTALLDAADGSRDGRARSALGTLALGVGERLPRERIADLLGAVADRLTFEDGLAEEVAARAAGARQQQRLLAFLVPALALYLALTMPTLASTLGSDLGRFVLLPAAAMLEVAGVVLGRRIVRDAVR